LSQTTGDTSESPKTRPPHSGKEFITAGQPKVSASASQVPGQKSGLTCDLRV